MNISEFILELEKIKAKEGDLALDSITAHIPSEGFQEDRGMIFTNIYSQPKFIYRQEDLAYFVTLMRLTE